MRLWPKCHAIGSRPDARNTRILEIERTEIGSRPHAKRWSSASRILGGGEVVRGFVEARSLLG